MPTVAEILAGIDSFVTPAKRRVVDMLMNPRAAMAQTAGRLSDDSNAALRDLNTQADANMLRAQGSVMADLPQYRQAEDASRQRIVNMLMNFAPVGATVWHGSPHKFDKFDSSKIGTGEGAQAYGHGLYFADEPVVAKGYAETTREARPWVIDGRRFHGTTTRTDAGIGNYAADALERFNGDKKAAIAWLKDGGPTSSDAAKFLSKAKTFERDSGSLYKVDLPDEAIAKMLDWDKPLSQQAPEVQKALDAVMQKRAAAAEAERLAMNEQYPARLTHPVLSKIASKPRTAFDYKGEAAVSALVQELGGPAKAAEYLRAQGIPGIRYLDGGSRSAGQGTSNYVVFPGNEGLLNILERNGKPIK